jgi:branched-subunit amino acid transport protein
VTAAYIWAAVIGMAVTTYALRALPITVLSRVRIPRPLERWLSFVPVSVMAALVASEVVRPDGRWLAPASNPYLLAAIPTGIVYHFTKSLLGATLAGVACFLAFRALLG